MTEPSIIAWLDDEMSAAYTAEELADGGGFVPLVTLADWQRTEAARVEAEDMAAQAAKGAAALIDTVNELRAQLAEAQRDAKRYRWLRSDDISRQPDQREICVIMVRSPFDKTLVESELDAAVDAAMATSPAAPQWPHPDGVGGGLMGET
jgi:hypothetical protein